MSENHERYCARQLALQEAEEFLAVGDAVYKVLNPDHEADRAAGRANRLPDLLSVRYTADGPRFRLREVKFKLDRTLVEKAVGQLSSGLAHWQQVAPERRVDRVEIVVPTRGRPLKAPEEIFLGRDLGRGRRALQLDGREIVLAGLPVSVLFL